MLLLTPLTLLRSSRPLQQYHAVGVLSAVRWHVPLTRTFALRAKRPPPSSISRGGGSGPPRAAANPGPAASTAKNNNSDSSSSRPVANEAITVPRVRVVDRDGKSLGVMATADGVALAREQRLDLVMIQPTAQPPVCRLISRYAAQKRLEEAAAARRRAERDGTPKEMRYSARIDDHDLGIKTARVLAFLRAGRPVRVSVSFTSASAFFKEEPARRAVLGRVVAAVAEAGVGFCDAASIRGDGAALHALMSPSSPKPPKDWEKTLQRLAAPIRPPRPEALLRSGDAAGDVREGEDGDEESEAAIAAAAVAAAAAAGALPPVAAAVLQQPTPPRGSSTKPALDAASLPPPRELLKYAAPAGAGRPRGGGGSSDVDRPATTRPRREVDEDADNGRRGIVDAADVVPRQARAARRTGGSRRPRGGGDEAE